jgi:hypothetical protein
MQPADPADYSGNIRLRLPTDLHAKLTDLAESAGVSLNTLMVTMLAEGIARRAGAPAPREVAEALAAAVLDSIHQPTRQGQLVHQLDKRCPEWRLWIPSERLAALPKSPRAR